MRIYDSNRIAMMKSYQQTSNKPLDKNQPTKGQTGDQLQISSLAHEKLKQTIEDKAQQSNRIQELKDQIASGTYRADSENLAGKLLSVLKKGFDQS